MTRRTTIDPTTSAPTGRDAGAPVPASAGLPGPDGRRRPRLVLVGGVPGAGKSTALARVATAVPAVRVLDSESARERLRSRLPGAPYPLLRPVVHAWHAVRVLGAVLHVRGAPRGSDGPPEASEPPTLLVHDPATRRWRRVALALLARACGWSPVLVVLDVGLDDARRGQQERGRVVRGRAFTRHWRRYQAQRPRLVRASEAGVASGGWDGVHVVDRRSAPTVLASLVGRPSRPEAGARP
ncbi:hypothetical protein GCM10009809_34040 [Isoptericola hypogeus]|uniref:AAA domain-containing protein n=1 Tax=Isoptericola hypogeus TaxID=300179 RepID=A0ABN2JQY9_9MICO